ncbi:hypothetical protein KJ839_03305 [Patescibacteria group bacterium]|nr:hypothetical protein [Patescibacteria group bacterium]
MTLSESWKVIKKARWFIIIFTLVAALAAYWFVNAQPEKYKVSIGFDLILNDAPQAGEYQYGSYYDLKGGEIYSQTIISWLMTPSFVAEVYDNAEIGYEIDSFSQFTTRFKAKSYSAQNVIITFDDVYEPNAKKLAESIIELVETKSREVVMDGEGKPVWEAKADKPIIILIENKVWLVVVLGALGGLIVSIILVFLRYYFKNPDENRD